MVYAGKSIWWNGQGRGSPEKRPKAGMKTATALTTAGLTDCLLVFLEMVVMRSWVLSGSGGRQHPRVRKAQPGDGLALC